MLAAIRWRSGLDADLDELRARTGALSTRLDATRSRAEAAEAELLESRRAFDARLEELRSVVTGFGAELPRVAARLESTLPALEDRVGSLEANVAALESRLVAAADRLEAHAAEVRERHATSAEEAARRMDELARDARQRLDRLGARIDELGHVITPPSVWSNIVLRSLWSSLAPLAAKPAISIVLATRNRSALLRRAIASVVAQSYPHWELLVVNDGSTDDTGSIVEAFGDERIRIIDGAGAGAGHARNLGLAAASGPIVTFLDDDNLMAPGWLRAVALAFEERPERIAVYGAQLRAAERLSTGDPSLLFVSPFDWERLLQHNFIDIGVVAHRTGLSRLSFDEALPRLIDWDYIVRLAGSFGLEPLPVVASVYTTDAPLRISYRDCLEREADKLRRRFRDAFAPPAATADGPAADMVPVERAADAAAAISLETRGSSKAWMTAADADLLEDVLERVAHQFGGDLRVLEWGGGLSTLHYPDWLARRGARVSWTTIEHDRGLFRGSLEPTLRERGATIVWSEDIAATMPALADPGRRGVTAVVFDKGAINPFDANPSRYTERAKDLDDYVTLPASFGLRFHVVIVDGRKRRRCLLEAARLLEPGGIALLHDAQRPYYHPAFTAYRCSRRIGDELWVGALHDTDFEDVVPAAALSSPGFEYTPGA